MLANFCIVSGYLVIEETHFKTSIQLHVIIDHILAKAVPVQTPPFSLFSWIPACAGMTQYFSVPLVKSGSAFRDGTC